MLRAQTAFEYLLVIAGTVLLASITLMMVRGNLEIANNAIDYSLGGYAQSIHDVRQASPLPPIIPSLRPTPSPSPSPFPSPSPTPTLSPTPSPTPSTSPTPSPSPTPDPICSPSLSGASAANVSGYYLGGGWGYNDIKTTGNYIVSTKGQLISALGSATAGQVIYVTQGTTIDLTGTLPLAIPAGVTLASNRGNLGSPGASIKKSAHTPGFVGNQDMNGFDTSSWEEPMFYVTGNNVRVTGLQLEGEMKTQDDASVSEDQYLVGVYANGRSGFEVDNNEIRGWSWSGVTTKNCQDPHIHHNYIHHNQARSEGYGFEIIGGNALFDSNVCDYNRHTVDAQGVSGEKGIFRYNVLKGNGDAIGANHFEFENNYPPTAYAGDNYTVDHNTFMNGHGVADPNVRVSSIHILAPPDSGLYIYNNLFQAISTTVPGGVPIYQTISGGSGLVRMFASNNCWMDTVYTGNSGIIWLQS